MRCDADEALNIFLSQAQYSWSSAAPFIAVCPFHRCEFPTDSVTTACSAAHTYIVTYITIANEPLRLFNPLHPHTKPNALRTIIVVSYIAFKQLLIEFVANPFLQPFEMLVRAK